MTDVKLVEEFEYNEAEIQYELDDMITELDSIKDDIFEQKEVIQAIGRIRYLEAVNKLTNILKHTLRMLLFREETEFENIEARLADVYADFDGGAIVTIEALGEIGSPDAVQTLFEVLHTGFSWSAAKALARMGSPAIPSLTKALQDDDVRTRMSAVRALGEIGDKEAVEALKKVFLILLRTC